MKAEITLFDSPISTCQRPSHPILLVSWRSKHTQNKRQMKPRKNMTRKLQVHTDFSRQHKEYNILHKVSYRLYT